MILNNEDSKIVTLGKFVNKFLVVDKSENYYDLYIFNEMVNSDEIKNTIRKVKKDLVGEWSLEDIETAIKNKFGNKLEMVKLFDYDCNNVFEVLEDE